MRRTSKAGSITIDEAHRASYAKRYSPGSIPYRACMNGYYDDSPALKAHVAEREKGR